LQLFSRFITHFSRYIFLVTDVRRAKGAAASPLHPGPNQGQLLRWPARQRGASYSISPSFLVLRSEYTLITCALGQSQLTKYPVLTTFEQRTQVPKSYAVLGGITLLTILHLINPLAAPVSNLVGWALPAYLSFKAIESPSSQDDIQWLTYWVVFGFFNFLESFALRVVLYYFPWYFAFKTVFILWLQLPAFRVSFPAFQPPIVLCLILFYSRIFPTLTLLCSLRAHKSLILPS